MKAKLHTLKYTFLGLIGVLLLLSATASMLTAPETQACATTPNCGTWNVSEFGCISLTCSCAGNPISFTCYEEFGQCITPNTNNVIFRKCYVGGCCCPSGNCAGGSSSGGGSGGCFDSEDCECDCVCVDGLCSFASPIVIDVAGNGFNLTNASNGVNFDLNADGRAMGVAWTSPASDDAWLVLDRNANGLVDNGAELFGNLTPQPASSSPNGFIALAEFDKAENGGNNDGRMGAQDAIFSSLRLWQDVNHNATSETNELHTLPSLNVVAIDLEERLSGRVDQNGNQFRYRAKVYDQRGASVGRWAWDVFLAPVQ